MRSYRALASFLIISFLSACGGGGGGESSPATPTLQSGVLLDGAVQGVSYSSAGASGVTDASGTFQFASGQTVNFCVGNFVGGVCQGLNLGNSAGRFLMQMRDLSPTTQAEQNKLRLLQALDSDNNLNNGINISTAVRTAVQGLSLNFDQSTTNFGTAFAGVTGSLASALGRTPSLPSVTAAQDHANRSLACELTGIYRGRYTGSTTSSDSGVFEAIIQPNGVIVIRGMSTRDSSRFSGIGSVPTSGSIDSFLLGTTSTNASFIGRASSTGLSGTWSNSSVTPTQSGTYSGTRVAVSLPAGASGDVYRGVFSGDDMGSFVLAINSGGSINGRFYQASDNTTGLIFGNRFTGTTTTVTGTFPAGNYSGTIRNDGKSVFLDGSWSSFQDGTTYNGYAMGCLVGSPSSTPIVPAVVAITPSPTTSSTPNNNNGFINSGTSGVTGGGGGTTISRATLDRVITQLQTSNTCCIPGTF
jgi:hypothetical protein